MENNQKEIKLSTLYNKVIITWFVTFVLLLVFGFYVYPNLSQIWEQKDILRDKISTYEKVEKDWITYNEFRDLATKQELKDIILKAWEDYFVSNLKNEDSKDYLTFIQKKKDYVDEINKSDVIKVRDEKLAKILPSYTEWFFVEWNMTELDFVNYVELLLRTFSLRTDSKIWMEDLVLEEKEDNKKNDKNNKLSSQIFYIPLSLTLEWRKADIVEFIYFLQKVWVPSSITNENIIFTNNNLVNRTISWQKRAFGYNIYENRIIDISSITLPKYVDTSTLSRSSNQISTEWFLNFIRTGSEKDDSYMVDIDLKFYVKWLPTYKIEEYIQKVITKYETLSSQTQSLLTKAQNRNKVLLNGEILDILATLKSFNKYLADKEQEIKILKNGLAKKVDLNNLYKKASLINYDLLNLEQYIQKINVEENLK